MRHPTFHTACLLVAIATAASAAPSTASEPTSAGANPLQDVTLKYAFPPLYPDAALKTCAHGKTRVRVRVDELGALKRVTLEGSSGNEDLDKAAITAVKGWQFFPRVIDGVPQGGEVIVPVNFQDPCPVELDVDDPNVRGLIAPPGWDSKTSPHGWDAYEVTTGRTAHPPKFPKAALKACAGGVVQLRVAVAANGFVRNVVVDKTSGNADLDAAALEAAKFWQYRPGRRDDTVVGGDVIVPVHYQAPC